jgi:outer membrane protein assembly complex protein YaeT
VLRAALTFAVTTTGFNQIRFEGNRHVSARTLRSVIVMKERVLHTESEIDRDAFRLAQYYREHGFLDAEVKWRKDSTANKKALFFQIREGRRALIRTLEVTNTRNFPGQDLVDLLSVRRRDVMILSELYAAREQLLVFYRNQGYFFAQCTLMVTRVNNGPTPLQVDVNYQVREGPVCYFRRLQVRGNRQVSHSLIRRYTGIRPGERFAQSRLVTAQHRLYTSRLFERIYLTVLPADTADTTSAHVLSRATDSLDVRVDISELSPRSIGFGVGLQLPPWRGLVSAEWEHLNVANEGHNFRASADYSPVASREFLRDYIVNLNLLYRIPYVTRWAVNFSTQPFGKWTAEKGLRQLEFGAETGMSHDFSPALTAGLLNRLRRVVLLDSVPTGTVPIRAITNSLSANLTWDTRNDVFNPTSGDYLAPKIEVAGGFLAGDNNFYRATLEGRIFRRLFFNHVIALRALGGYVLPYGHSNLVPYFEEFYLGGSNSLRGYDEKSVGPVIASDSNHYGDVMVNTNLELRSPYATLHNSLVRGLGGVVFLDGGMVRSRTEPSVWDKYQFAVGAGIRLNTVIGPVRLDYGRRLTDRPAKDWGKIHFAILNLF